MLSPRDPGAVTLDVSFPALAPGTAGARQARLVAWVPPRAADHQGPVADGSLEWGGDLAVLELDEEPPPPVGPVRWLDMRAGQLVRAWYGGGQPFSYADVQVGSCDGRIGYLDGQLSGAAVDDGYSGGPLWSPADGAAVGLVMGRITPPDGEFDTQHTVRRSWGLTWQSVRQELLRVGAAPDPAAPGAREPVGGDESVRDMMVGPLHALLGDPTVRAAHSTALGAALGLRTRADGTAPSVEELAVVLCTVERALPTLAESLAPSLGDARGRAQLDRLLALGRLTDAAGLLSVAEHRALLVKWDHLTRHDPGLLPRAATAALPYVDLPRSLTAARLDPDEVPGAVRELEEWPGDGSPVPDETPRLPALLRVVEYAAAETGGIACQALQEWSGRVADRLGIHPSALGERRADAARWSDRSALHRGPRPGGAQPPHRGPGRPLPVRGVADARRRHGRPHRHRHRTPAHRAGDRPPGARGGRGRGGRGAERGAGRGVRRPGRAAPAGGRVGRGERGGVLPGAAGRGLPPGAALPADQTPLAHRRGRPEAPLGRPAPERTARRGPPDLRRDGAHPAAQDNPLRRRPRHSAQAPGSRTRLLHFCLAMGVPIVLWDRAAGEPGGAALDAAGPYGPVDELPERVRHFRVRAYMDPEVPARPALVWEDAELPLPDELQLADPSRGPEGIARPSEGTDQAT